METKTAMLRQEHQYEFMKQYYGKILQKSSDLKTDACCVSGKLPGHIEKVLPLIDDEIRNKYYGCGSPIPMCLENLKVLDIGCGTGRDCYVMSKLIGQQGFVYGIDMTEDQIAVARKYIGKQMQVFGYSNLNVEFIMDYIESLDRYFEKESLDIVTSNCVINLTDDKEVILQKVYGVLKFGGEMYFSDVYSDRRVPEQISGNALLRSECLGGALYYKDFERMVGKVGFTDPRIVSKRAISINNKQIENLVGNITFCSITYRLWKLKGLEDGCEDYGHIAVYNGRAPELPFKFELDSGHIFYKNKPERICGNTALMLSETRFKKYFEVSGSFKEHFGTFANCSNTEQNNTTDPISSGCC